MRFSALLLLASVLAVESVEPDPNKDPIGARARSALDSSGIRVCAFAI